MTTLVLYRQILKTIYWICRFPSMIQNWVLRKEGLKHVFYYLDCQVWRALWKYFPAKEFWCNLKKKYARHCYLQILLLGHTPLQKTSAAFYGYQRKKRWKKLKRWKKRREELERQAKCLELFFIWNGGDRGGEEIVQRNVDLWDMWLNDANSYIHVTIPF